MKTSSTSEIEKLQPLFWEYHWQSVKQKFTSNFVIARVLELGTPEQFKILVLELGDRSIKEFLSSNSADKLLSKRSLNYWRLYYGITAPTSESDQ